LDTLAIGCLYVVNFVLPFAIELSIKAILAKEGKDSKFVHDLFMLYKELSEETKQLIQNEYIKQCRCCEFHEIDSFENLIIEHKTDFVGWRYLDNAENLKRNDKKMQIAICALLEIYNTLIE